MGKMNFEASKLAWWIVGVVVLVTIIVVSVFSTASRNEVDFSGRVLVVEKRLTSADEVLNPEYGDYRKVESSEDVQRIGNFISDLSYEKAKVDMAHPADYTFSFDPKDGTDKSALYELWKSPGGKRVEIVVDAESKYVHLSEKDSKFVLENVLGEGVETREGNN